MSEPIYGFSFNGEQYTGHFDSREDARAEAEDYGRPPDTQYWTARYVTIDLADWVDLDWGTLREQAYERLYGEVGDVIEGSVPDLDETEAKSVERLLRLVLSALLEKHGAKVGCYQIADVEEHWIPDHDDAPHTEQKGGGK